MKESYQIYDIEHLSISFEWLDGLMKKEGKKLCKKITEYV